MSDPDNFYALKAAVESHYRTRHPACLLPIQEWKGQEIVNFQEDLQATVQGRISEKWFYTHIKAETNSKLPRIDMLNMLSQYAGFRDWQEFLFAKAPLMTPLADIPVADAALTVAAGAAPVQARKRGGMRMLLWGSAAAVVISAGILLLAMKTPTTYTFCFVDADQHTPLADAQISVTILRDEESPLQRTADKEGCFSYPTDAEKVRFAVHTPYYKPDTITRLLNKSLLREEIPLKADDYALMIHVFSTSSLEDWQKRRAQLDDMIAESAEIFQLSPEDLRGMEIYNKQEFINKMTMPLKSLRNVEVLETRYDWEGKINGMRFVQLASP